MLHAERRGKGPPVVLLHGFTQTGASWGPVADRLSGRHTVVTVDAPGHGGSSSIRADLTAGAAMMVEAAGDAGSWVGYSMGGRFALHAALSRPDSVERLVLVSATGGIDDEADRRARRRADEELARMVEAEGVEPFVRWWLERPLFATLSAGAAGLGERLSNTAEGLATSLRLAGTGTQLPLWDRLASLAMPVLVVAGELDQTFVGHAERLVSCVGDNASLSVIPGAGHACHLERPDAFLAVVAPFLDAAA